MKRFEEDEAFLARWAANELSAEELKEFQAENEFELFDKINKEALSFSIAKADVKGDYQKIKDKLSSKGKVIRFNRFFYAAVSIAIILSLFGFLNSSKTFSAEFGKKLLAELPDSL